MIGYDLRSYGLGLPLPSLILLCGCRCISRQRPDAIQVSWRSLKVLGEVESLRAHRSKKKAVLRQKPETRIQFDHRFRIRYSF